MNSTPAAKPCPLAAIFKIIPNEMIKAITILILLCTSTEYLSAQTTTPPDTVTVESGQFQLKGLLWRPVGTDAFPAVVFCHGTYETNDTLYDVVQQTSLLGPLFAKHGYIFFGLFHRGVGLSRSQGENSADMMAKALKEKGQDERNKVQIQQLQKDELVDIISALTFLRKREDIDTNRIAIMGHSFGGLLALLAAEHDRQLKAVIIFGAGGYSWNLSSQLRARLFDALKNVAAPIMIVHAQNDYSVTPGYALDSVITQLNKPHVLKIYPQFGQSLTEGHNIIFLSTNTWETDAFNFLNKYLLQ